LTGLIIPSSLVVTASTWSKDKTNEENQAALRNSSIEDRLATVNYLSQRANAGQNYPILPGIIPQLINALHDENIEVRARAIDALTGIGTGAEDSILPLLDILQDQSQPPDLRRSAILAVRSIYAGPAIEELNKALRDPDRVVRSTAAGALGSVREKARKAVPILMDLVKNDPFSEVRASAAEVLGKIDPANKEVWNTLNEALRDRSWRVRRSAADTFAEIGVVSTVALPNLLLALENQNYTLQTSAATTLGVLGPAAKSAIPELKNALVKNNNPFVRAQAALAIGNIGSDDPTIFEALIVSMENDDAIVRSKSYEAFHKLVEANSNKLFSSKERNEDSLKQTIKFLDDALEKIENPKNGFSNLQKETMKTTLRQFQAKHAETAFFKIILLNPWFWLIASLLMAELGLFWLRPLWLLKIDEMFKPLDIKVPTLGGGISPRLLLFLKYHPRVLDAWIDCHIQCAQQEFLKLENVEARKVFIPSPVTLDGRTVAEVTNRDFGAIFDKPVLIWGEGGVGKTSLACQIAQWAMSDKPDDRICKHRMLPIILEEDLDCDEASSKKALLDAILGQLKMLIHEEDPIPDELLVRLLRRRRILVIVDHLSEMNQQTRKAINPDSPDFPINALIVTSRQKEILGQLNKLTIKPLRIMGNRLSSFMEAYLTKEGKRELFTDPEFFDACGHLSRMVGQREVTAMLATLFARQMINAKVEAAQDVTAVVSDNIPDLMLSYLNQLNKELGESKASQDQFDDRTVHKDAMVVAWACLQETFRPGVIKRETALQALTDLRGEHAEDHLRYLEERLLLIQTIGPSQDQLRFSLDPLAEYLAAMHLVELYDGHEESWLSFLAQAEAKYEGTTSISGLLSAVQDCWIARGKETKTTPLIFKNLLKIQGLMSATPMTSTQPTQPVLAI